MQVVLLHFVTAFLPDTAEHAPPPLRALFAATLVAAAIFERWVDRFAIRAGRGIGFSAPSGSSRDRPR